jgi:hypothetical protein
MALWICFIVAIIAGALGGGWQSLRLARAGQFSKATMAVRTGGVVAGICAGLALFLTLGWPMKERSVSVPEEVSRTFDEAVQVPVRIWVWFVPTPFKRSDQKIVRHTVTETVVHSVTERHFSVWLAILMVLIAWAVYLLEVSLIRFVWRLRG